MCSMKKCLINRLLRPRQCGCGTPPEQTLVDQGCNDRNGEEPNQGPFVLFAPCLHDCNSIFFSLQRSLALFANHYWKGYGMGPNTHITNYKRFAFGCICMVSAANCRLRSPFARPCAARGGGPTGPTTWPRSASQIQQFIFGIWFSLVSCFRAGRARANLYWVRKIQTKSG